MIDVQWAFISIVTASLAHFILRIVIGRELGADGLGLYTLVFTVYLFGSQFAAFGIHAALTKYVAEYIDNLATIKIYVSSGMISSVITGAIMGIALFLLAPYIAISVFKTPELTILIQLTAFSYPFIAIQKAVLGTLNGFRRMRLFAFLNIIQNVSVVGVSVALVRYFEMGLLGAVVGLIGPTVFISLLSPFLIKDPLSLDSILLWRIPVIREINVFGFYVVLGNTISYLNTQIGSILIGYYLGPTDVGIYAVAVLLAQTLTLIPSAVQQVTAPVIATLYGKGEIESVRKVIFSTMKKCVFLSLILAGCIALFGQYLIGSLFTTEYLPAYGPLLILLLGQTVFAGYMAVSATLPTIGKLKIPFRINAICALLNIVLNVLLIPPMGINGSAIATTITLVISFTINATLIHKFTSIKEIA
jgi:stage V sporulation protein B